MSKSTILSVTETIDRLPMDRSAAEKWLRACDLVRTVAGAEIVIWSDVVEVARSDEPDPEKYEAAVGAAQKLLSAPMFGPGNIIEACGWKGSALNYHRVEATMRRAGCTAKMVSDDRGHWQQWSRPTAKAGA